MVAVELVEPDRFRRLFREGFWIVVGQILVVAGTLLGVRMLTALLTPAEYGELALKMTIFTLVGQIVISPISNGSTRFYAPAAERNDLYQYFQAVKYIVFYGTKAIGFLAVVSVIGLFLLKRSDLIFGIVATFIFALINGYNSILSGVQNAARQRAIVALHQGAEAWARYGIGAGMLFWMAKTSSNAMLGFVIGGTIVLLSQYLFFKKVIPLIPDSNPTVSYWKNEIFKFSFPFASWGFFSWAQLASDRWALGMFSSTKDVGLYAVVFQLGYYPTSMATGMVVRLLEPIFYQRAGDATVAQRNQDVATLSWRLTCVAILLSIFAFFLTLIFHNQIFHIFVSKAYASAAILLPWLLLAGGLFAAGQTISVFLQSQMKTQAMMLAKIITAILGIAANFIGAYLAGTKGVVIGINIFSLIYFVWMLALFHSYAGENPFSLKK